MPDDKQQQQADPKGNGSATLSAEELKSLNEGVKGLRDTIGELAKLARESQQQRQQQTADDDNNAGDSAADDEPQGPSAEDLELMSRADFADHLLSIVKQAIDASIKPVGERLSEVNSRINGNTLATRVRELGGRAKVDENGKVVEVVERGRYKDYWDWQPEMVAMLRDKPHLGNDPEDLYHLVRARNPQKAKELDGKYAEATAPKPDAKKRLPFGGLAPQDSSAATQPNRKMDGKTAVEAAWDEVTAKYGEPPI